MKNVFETIAMFGADDEFAPLLTDNFVPTSAEPGSRKELEVMAERVKRGLPLWHPKYDRGTRNIDLWQKLHHLRRQPMPLLAPR